MIETRAYCPADKTAFLGLYRACLAHYGIKAATKDEEARIVRILGTAGHVNCLMAYDDNAALGFATWVLTLPAGTGVALYMKELFVLSNARGRGVGRALMAGLVQIAQSEGCERFDWQTDATNQMSQRFYECVRAPVQDKKSYRIPAAEYETFLKSLRER